MVYATLQDIEIIYSATVLDRVAYSYEADGRDVPMVERALTEASSEIDMYLSVAFTMPLPRIPPMVRQLTVDIAVYRMCLTSDKMTDQIENRYKMAIKSLEMIAAGKLGLGLPNLNDDGVDDGLNGSATEFSTMDSILI